MAPAAHEFVVETTPYNESASRVRDGLQTLTIKHDVDVVVAPMNPVIAHRAEPILRGQQTPLLALTMGEVVFAGDVNPPWVFTVSMNLWRSAWLTGWWAVGRHGPRICNLSTHHASGYGMSMGFALGVEAAGGELLATIPGPSGELGEAAAAEMVARAIGYDADAVMLTAASGDIETFVRALDADPVPTLRLAPHEFGTGPYRSALSTVSVWDPTSPTARRFVDRFVDATGQPAHAYALLAHEAGHLLAAAAGVAGRSEVEGEPFRQRLAAARFDGPRGDTGFTPETLEVVTRQYLHTADDGGPVVGPLDPPAVLDEQVSLARRNLDKSGWTNPYLIA